MSLHSLYRFYDGSGKLLYIGITSSPSSRFSNHREGKDWWRTVAQITLKNYESRADLEDAERLAIIKEKPLYNVTHNRVRLTPTERTAIAKSYTLQEVVDAGYAPSIRWLREALNRGEITGIKVGRRGRTGRTEWRMTDDDLEQFIASRRNAPRPESTVTSLNLTPAALRRRRAS